MKKKKIHSIIFKSFFWVTLILLQINISFGLNTSENDKWHIQSTSEIKYYDENNQLITTQVCLRTLKSKLKIRKIGDDERWGGTMYGTLIYDTETWELVLSPNTSDESIIILDNLYIIKGELHNGKLYNASLLNNDSEERLFIYFYQYGTSSNELAYFYYFDVNSKTLKEAYFDELYSGKQNSIERICKSLDNYEIFPISLSEMKKYKIDENDYTISVSSFQVGDPNLLVSSFFVFNNDDFCFREKHRIIKNHGNGKTIKVIKRKD